MLIQRLDSLLAAFVQGLRELGWSDGIDRHIEERRTTADATRAPALTKKLIELQPDVIVTGSTTARAAPHRENENDPDCDPLATRVAAGACGFLVGRGKSCDFRTV